MYHLTMLPPNKKKCKDSKSKNNTSRNGERVDSGDETDADELTFEYATQTEAMLFVKCENVRHKKNKKRSKKVKEEDLEQDETERKHLIETTDIYGSPDDLSSLISLRGGY